MTAAQPAVPSAFAALRVRDLAYAYPDGRPALHGVDLDLAPGERLAVVGANGAGKSTLLLAVAGLLDGITGVVEAGGVTLSRATRAEVRRRVGLVFQDPDDQVFMPTVADELAFGPLNQGLDPAEVRARVDGALAAVDLAGYEDRGPHHLSGGEKRRVALAAILACGPQVLALDEPSSGLDPRARRRIIELLNARDGAMLVATHDLELVLDLCNRVMVLGEGRVAAQGDPRQVLADAALMEAHGLEVPWPLRGAAIPKE